MNINIENFARNTKPKELRWFVGKQLPEWIREMLKAKADGGDPAQIIDALAEVCCIKEEEKET